MEKSIYSADSEYPEDYIDDIEKLVLLEPAGGFPPIFTLEYYPFVLFVSAEARKALENADVKGIIYDTLDKHPF